MKQRFQVLCWSGKLADLKRIVNYGYDINELIKISDGIEFDETIIAAALQNRDIDILKYLLESNIDYKRYEINMIETCIKNRRFQALKTLMEYGINISVIDNINIEKNFNKVDIDICKLLIGNANPLIVALLMAKFNDN